MRILRLRAKARVLDGDVSGLAVRVAGWIAVALTVSGPAWGQAGTAREPARAAAQAGAVYAVIHIDVDSSHVGEAVAALREYARGSRGQAGCERLEVLEEPTRGNHFTVLESWGSAGALQTHEDSGVARRMRGRLQPFLGSPFDERLHRRVE